MEGADIDPEQFFNSVVIAAYFLRDLRLRDDLLTMRGEAIWNFECNKNYIQNAF